MRATPAYSIHVRRVVDCSSEVVRRRVRATIRDRIGSYRLCGWVNIHALGCGNNIGALCIDCGCNIIMRSVILTGGPVSRCETKIRVKMHFRLIYGNGKIN